MKKVILTGGGTAGHVMPNLALLPHLSGMEIHYIGSDGMEKSLLKNTGVCYHEIECVKLARQITLKNLKIPFALIKSVRAAGKIIRQIMPDVIFSKGGYVGLPVALACPSGVPLLLHESDTSMGLANKLAYPKCSVLFTAFDSIKNKKSRCVGAILRDEIYKGDKSAALRKCRGMTEGKPYLLVFGGSLGAKSLNEAVYANIDALLKDYNVLHITGRGNASPIKARGYFSAPFVDDIYDFFALADVAVSRGGANSLCELMALKIPTLCVPLSTAASRGDQIKNAEYFADRGCLNFTDDADLCRSLTDALAKTMRDAPNLIANMKKLRHVDATATVAEAIKNAAVKAAR
ncbi:MAG TPA: UDP-N-acetylglucosamine--N-acetylmuramyl-(pentapeptide) pyrophosphoryl-undecaprenol N-acetylglucosamine transferase [Firmicutes bacterium]|nr:UDP-N-acetylglucosamine--N-acetylmuramyl-(pentapeptide) pyrophosphoryl-undecaprenol N-acetylglucosamine transferase [Bacillota bacterium]